MNKPSHSFVVGGDVAKRNQVRKEIILQERIHCLIRMVRNNETNEKIALYTTFDLETVEKMRKKLDELMADAQIQKSMAFHHHGLIFHPRKTSWLSRVKMASRYRRSLHAPNSCERLK